MTNIYEPPHSLESEQGVIGSLLQKNEIFDDVTEVIKENQFYSRSHRIIFNCICELMENGIPADLTTVSEKLEQINRINDVGGFVYIAQVIKNTVSASNAMAYAEIVRERHVKRELLAVANNIQEIVYNGIEDSKETCSIAENLLSSVSDEFTVKSLNKSMREISETFIDELEKRCESGGGIQGISTGLTDLDNKISGLVKSDFIVLAARPSMGKTTLAMNMVEHEALKGGFPLVFSLEMPSEQLFNRLISGVGSVDLTRINHGNLSDDDWVRVSNAMSMINETNLEINDNSTMSVQDIRLACREYKKRKGDLTLIMIDYLQLIRHKKSENRTQEISEISRGLKALAKEFKCPVLALSQLNRGLESRSNKRPINSDLRESGQIEQDADVIMFIYRDEVYNEDSQDKGLAEIIIGKARNGTIGMVGSVFDGGKSKFRNLCGKAIVGEIEEQTSYF